MNSFERHDRLEIVNATARFIARIEMKNSRPTVSILETTESHEEVLPSAEFGELPYLYRAGDGAIYNTAVRDDGTG